MRRVRFRAATHAEAEAARRDIAAQERWAEHWENRHVYVLTYRPPGKTKEIILGYCRHWTEDRHNGTHVLLSLTVHDRYRGIGFGGLMADTLITRVAPAGAWWLDVEHPEQNPSLVRFYLDLGFQIASSDGPPAPYNDPELGLKAPLYLNLPQAFLRRTPDTAKSFKLTFAQRLCADARLRARGRPARHLAA